MSFNLSRTVGHTAMKFLCRNNLLSNSVRRTSGLPSACLRAGTPRGLTRSLWYLASRDTNRQIIATGKTHSKHCGCCRLHTQGDKELGEFLTEEIELENKMEKMPGQAPKFTGFDVVCNGAEVTLSRKQKGETITIKWNVNDTIDDGMPPQFEEGNQEEEPEVAMVSKPMFQLFLNKGGPTSLAIQCSFPQAEDDQQIDPSGEQGLVEDALEISEVAMVPGLDWDSKLYSVMATVMDGNLYALLLTMLEDRGIDAKFMDSLSDFSTAYEHKQYIDFLKQLQKFTQN